MRTAHGISPRVGAGNAWFTLIGFMGLYTVLANPLAFPASVAKSNSGPNPTADSAAKTAVAIAAD